VEILFKGSFAAPAQIRRFLHPSKCRVVRVWYNSDSVGSDGMPLSAPQPAAGSSPIRFGNNIKILRSVIAVPLVPSRCLVRTLRRYAREVHSSHASVQEALAHHVYPDFRFSATKWRRVT
jgi:hypothetical protein